MSTKNNRIVEDSESKTIIVNTTQREYDLVQRILKEMD